MSDAAPLLADDTNALPDERSRVSYALGMMVGQTWKSHGATDLDYDLVMQGIKDVQAGNSPLMSVSQMRTTLGQYQQELAKQQEEKREELAAKNLQIADAFMAKNKNEKGVITMPDGLQYKIIADGSGPTPANGDTVTVSYEGTLTDGTQFDSSDKASFQLTGIIPGWREALLHMKVGSEWQLFIAPDLAYGPYGRPPQIEPNSVLIFKIRLLSIEHPKPVTSDIIKVPSAEEMKRGAKVEIIKPEDAQKMQEQSQAK